MSEEHNGDASAAERRGHRRYAVEGVRGNFLLSTEAKVVNMSLDGVALEIDTPLKVGWKYTLKLHDGGDGLTMDGTVVWCNLVATRRDVGGDVSPVYRAGIRFEDVLQDRAAALRDFIETNAVISLEKRLFGRFRIDRDQGANIDCEAEFQVEQLSLTGMLIRTELGPRIDAVYEMEVRFPEVRFRGRARIVRVEPISVGEEEPSRTRFRVGVEFLELSDGDRRTLEGFLEGLAG